jgi:Ca-activated chloride channel homolog
LARKLKTERVVRTGLMLATVALLATPHEVDAVTTAARLAARAPLVSLQDQQPRPTFRASVERVAVAAVVRDERGKPVTNLDAGDFELYDAGRPVKIADFKAGEAPVNLALLADYSGSMDVAAKREALRAITGHLLSWLTEDTDQVALFAFDRTLQELHPFAPAPGTILDTLTTLKPFGKTSLFDAIAETGQRVATLGGTRRAIVALTDGADNASSLSPAEVAGIASAIDVPVYIIVVVSPLDRAERSETVLDAQIAASLSGRLGDLARRTGGEIFAAVGPAKTSLAARQIIGELRHQYLIAFEPSSQPGWHPIDLRTRDKDLVVRARSGYVVRTGSVRP